MFESCLRNYIKRGVRNVPYTSFLCCCCVVGNRRTAGLFGCLQTYKLTNSQIRQLTNSPTHKLASSSTYELTHLYINKVYILVMLSLCKETQKLALRFDIFLKKACVVFKKALPLHPLSGTKFFGSD